MHFVYLFFLLLISTTCLAETLEGHVVRIVDGDKRYAYEQSDVVKDFVTPS